MEIFSKVSLFTITIITLFMKSKTPRWIGPKEPKLSSYPTIMVEYVLDTMVANAIWKSALLKRHSGKNA